MAKLVPIIVRLDGSQAKAEIASLGKGLDALNNRAARQFTAGGSSSIDTRQMQDFVRMSKESARISEVNARSQARLAEETAKQITQAKQSELRQFESAEKSKQKITEISVQTQSRLNEELARRQTQSSKVGLKVFEDSEKSKQRIAEISARSQMKQAEIAARGVEAQKRREFQEYQRIERQKAQLAITKAGKYGAGDIAGLVGTAIASSTAVAGVYAILDIGAKYQASMNMLQAVTGATAAEMQKADGIAVQLGNDLSLPGMSAADAAEAMTELGKAGMSVEQAMAAAKGTLQLATAANISAAAAAEITANSLNMFGLQASEAGRVADLLAAAANASSAEIMDVAASLQQAGAVFHNANIPIETTVALIAEMANAGIKGSDAGTSLKTMLQRLQSPTNDAAAAIKGLNVDIYDQAGVMRPMRDIIAQFESGLKGLSQEQKDQALNTIFGADAVRGATIIFGQGAAGLDTMSQAVQRHNAAAELAAARSKGLGGAWENLKSQAETLGLTIFGSIAPALTTIVLGFANFIGLVGQYPVTFAAAAVSVGLLAVAFNAVNIAAGIQVLISYGSSLSGLVFIASNVARAMFGLQNAFIGLEVTVAAVAGWAALIAILGGVIYAFYNTESAISKANAVTLDSIKTNIDSLQSYKALQSEARNLVSASNEVSQAQTQSGDVHDRLNNILGRLDPVTAEYIKTLVDEKTKVEVLNEIIGANIEAQKALLEAKLRTAAEGSLEAIRQIQAENIALKSNSEQINQLAADRIKLNEQRANVAPDSNEWQVLTQAINENDASVRNLTQSNIAAGDKLKDFNTSLIENNAKILQATQGLGLNNEQLRQFFTNAGYSAQQVDILTAAAQKTTTAQNNLGTTLDNTASKAAGAAVEVFNLRKALDGLTSVNQQNIQNRMFNVISSAVDKNDLIQKAKQAKEDLKNDLAAVKQLKDFEKTYTDIVSPDEKKESGVSRIKKDATEAKKAVKDLRSELGDLASVLDAMRKGTIQQESGGRSDIKNIDSGATGAFQIMEGNIPAWTKKWLGKSMSVEAFRKDIQAQIAVFNGQMGEYLKTALQKAGGDIKIAIRMAAAAWYGRGEKSMGLYDSAKPQMYKGKEYPSFREYTNSVLQKTMGAAGGGKSLELKSFDAEASILNQILEKQDRLNQLKAAGLSDTTLQQQIQLSGLSDEVSQTEEILKLRQKLNFEITAPIPVAEEDRKEALRVLQEFDRRKESINSSIRSITEKLSGQGISTTFANVPPINPEEAKKQAEQWDLVDKSIDGFIQTGEQARQQVAELSAEFDDGMTSLQKFDLQVRLLKESGKLTAEQLDILNNVIPKTREELEKAANAEWAKKLRQDAKSVSDAFDNMTDDFKKRQLELTSEKSPLNDFLRSVEGIKDLNLGVGSLDGLKGLFTAGNQIDVEKFAKYVRYWLVLRSVVGDFDAGKIDDVIKRLKEAAQGYNEVSEATKNADFKTLKEGLSGQLDELQRGGRQLTEYEKMLRTIEKDYKNLDPAQKQYLLNLAAEIDAQRQWQKSYNDVYGVVRDSLQTLLDDGWGGFFKSILDRFKKMLLDMAAELITSKIMKFLTGQSSSSSGGGFSFGNIINQILGGGSNVTATPNFNPNSSGSGGVAGPRLGSSSSSSGSFNFSNIRSLFGLGGGSSSAPGAATPESARGSSGSGGGALAGGVAIAGMAANIIGGMIGGLVGNVISMAGTGMSIGMMVGGPWGAAIGAAAGAIAGLFMGDPKRKIDKKENMPKLQEGFAKAFEELRSLAADKNAILGDPTGSSARADELRAQIASGFGIDFQSKKYRNIAKTQIDQKLVEADLLIKQIKEFAGVAAQANIVQGKLKPEFAGGVYRDSGFMRQYSDFKRRNGMLAGAFTGRDTLPSMLAPGEMVLNPAQIERIKDAVGYDPFKFGRIPN
ncbi:MAG TPA: phage tail tape measure protein [Pyrinomonadaceae bacterium]|jgi:TP901 family phage tail tape measure protein